MSRRTIRSHGEFLLAATAQNLRKLAKLIPMTALAKPRVASDGSAALPADEPPNRQSANGSGRSKITD
jgi:hypothetical protein